MDCQELRARAAGLASLPADDPERRAAREHAATCEGCARALAEGERLMALLDEAPSPAPTPDALSRVAARVHREMATDARRLIRRLWLLLPVVAMGWLGLAAMGLSHGKEPAARAWVVSAAAAGVALATAGMVVRLRWIAMVGAGLASLAFALYAGAGSALAASVGIHCIVAELLCGAFAATAGGLLLWRHVSARSTLLAGIAASGALAAQAGLHLDCPVHDQLPHLLVFHTGGVVVAALVGLAVARLLQRPRREKTS